MKRCVNCDEEIPEEELDPDFLCPDCAEEADMADDVLGPENNKE